MEDVKRLIHESNIEVGNLAAKGSVGIFGSLAAMSINDMAGLIVAILTGVYMILQIEAAWNKRKEAKTLKDKSGGA